MNTSRIIIETMIRKAINEIQDSPQRVPRNLVDLALQFSTGDFQKQFFRMAQTMLKNENSAYYEMFQSLVSQTAPEKLVTFGINLGYNSCIHGTEKIREMQQQKAFYIPWSVILHIKSSLDPVSQKRYDTIVSQGEDLGIFTWQFFSEGTPENLLPVIAAHPNSAFILFCEQDDITEAFLDNITSQNNLMLMVHFGDRMEELCAELQKRKLLYSVYCQYSEFDIEEILHGDWLDCTEVLASVFTVFAAEPDCLSDAKNMVYEYVKKARYQQKYQTIPLELSCDHRKVSQIISGKPFCVAFASDGTLYHRNGKENIFTQSLSEVLQKAFPFYTSL